MALKIHNRSTLDLYLALCSLCPREHVRVSCQCSSHIASLQSFFIPHFVEVLGPILFSGQDTYRKSQTDFSTLPFLLALGPSGVQRKGRRCASRNIGEGDREGVPKKWEMVVEILGAVRVRKPEKRRNTVNDKNWSITVHNLVLLGTEEYANLLKALSS